MLRAIRRSPRTTTIAVFATGLAYAYLLRFRLPGTPIYTSHDEGIYTLAALRILDGEVPYRDFVGGMTPGIFYWLAGVMWLAGTRLAVVNAVDVLLGAVLCLVSYAMARKVASGPMALLPAVMVAAVAFRFSPQSTHNWYSVVFAVLALLAVLRDPASRTPASLLGAGMLAGVSVLFTQQRGVLALLAIAAWLCVEGGPAAERSGLGRRLGLVLLGSLVPWVPVIALLVREGALAAAFQDLVVFNVSRYGRNIPGSSFACCLANEMDTLRAATGGARLRSAVALVTNGALVAGLPIVYAVALVRIVRGRLWRGAARDRALSAVTVFGLALYVSGFVRASIEMHGFVLPPAAVVLAGLLARPVRFARAAKVTAAVLALWCLGVALTGAVRLQTRPMSVQASRAGTFAAHEPEPGVAWIIERTSPGQYAFFLPLTPDYYLLTGTRNPSRYFGLREGLATPDDARDVAASLDRRRVAVGLWNERDRREPIHAPLADYLSARYVVERAFGDAAKPLLALRRRP